MSQASGKPSHVTCSALWKIKLGLVGGDDPTKGTLPCPVQGQAGSLLLLLPPPMQSCQLQPRGIAVSYVSKTSVRALQESSHPSPESPVFMITGGWKNEKLTPDTDVDITPA